MKLNKMPIEEIEQYSYIELAEMILKEGKKSMNTKDIFKKICKLLNLDDPEFENKIGDFYTSLTTDKNFILLEDGTWDLRDHHSSEINLDVDSDDEDMTETEEEIEDEMDNMAPDEYHDMDDDSKIDDDIENTDIDDEDLDDVDDLDEDDLTIVDEDDLE